MLRSLRERIKGLAIEAQRDIISSAIDMIPGTEFVSNVTQEGRLTMCESCEHMDKKTRKCKICTCFIDETTRILKLPLLDVEKCPKNKW